MNSALEIHLTVIVAREYWQRNPRRDDSLITVRKVGLLRYPNEPALDYSRFLVNPSLLSLE